MKRFPLVAFAVAVAVTAFVAGALPAVAICEGGQRTYWACVVTDCSYSCEQYRCADDEPTGIEFHFQWCG